MDDGAKLAEAARGLIDVPFRMHGRDPRTGVDCVGLIALGLAAIGRKPVVPTGYHLRNSSIAPWLAFAHSNGLAEVSRPIRAGDILLTVPGPGQHHMLIADFGSHAIHAHAALRRVVRQPFPHGAALAHHWRLDSASEVM